MIDPGTTGNPRSDNTRLAASALRTGGLAAEYGGCVVPGFARSRLSAYRSTPLLTPAPHTANGIV